MPVTRPLAPTFAAAALFVFAVAAGAGTVATDGSLGRARTLPGPHFTIGPNLGQQRGGNLFHSFSTLNLDSGESATFDGPATVRNVFARVTGGLPSRIDGTLRCTIPNADFYLINPSGVVFGPDAALDLRGSFAVTTADYLKHADGAVFQGTAHPPAVLSSAAPAAFGFLGSHSPAGIFVKGTTSFDEGGQAFQPRLNPAPGKSLLVVGGSIRIFGGELASSAGGAAAVAAVASKGEAKVLTAADGALGLDVDARSFSRLGKVSVSSGGLLGSDAVGGGGFLGPHTAATNAGPVSVTAAHITVDGVDNQGNPSSLSSHSDSVAGALEARVSRTLTVSNGGFFGSSAAFNGTNAAAVHVTAANVIVDGDTSTLGSLAGIGVSGPVVVRASEQVRISNRGFLGSDALIGTNSGSVRVTAASVLIDNSERGKAPSMLASRAGGAAGAVRVRASGSVTLSDGFLGSDASNGMAGGPVRVTAASVAMSQSSELGSISDSGSADTVKVRTSGALSLSGGSLLSSDARGDGSHAGAVSVTAASVAIDGHSSALISRSDGGGAGAVKARVSGALTLTNGGFLGSDSAEGTGAGRVSVTAGAVTVDGSDSSFGASKLASRSDSGAAGAVRVRAWGALTLSNGGFLGSTAVDGTDASRVSVTAASITVKGSDIFGDPSTLTSRSGSGAAGGVEAKTTGTLTLDKGGFLGSSGTNAGPVNITALSVAVADGGSVQSTGETNGTAGHVELRASDILLDGKASALPTGISVNGPLGALAPGIASDIRVTAARSLVVRGGAGISADAFGTERAGAVRVQARSLTLDGGSITSRSFAGGQGGGAVDVEAGRLRLVNATISANNFRGGTAGGRVQIQAGDLALDQGSSISAAAGGGLAKPLTVQVHFSDLSLSDQATITLVGPGNKTRVLLANSASQTTFADGASGDLSLTAPIGFLSRFVAADLNGVWNLQVQAGMGKPVTLENWSLVLGNRKIGASTTPFSGTTFQSPLTVGSPDPGLTGGAGGDVAVRAGKLSVQGGSSITTGTVGTGKAGAVLVETHSLLVAGRGSSIESTSALPPLGTPAEKIQLGAAGGVAVTSSGQVRVRDGGTFSVEEAGPAAGGDIVVRAGTSIDLDRAVFSASASNNGGNIRISAPLFITLRNRSRIVTTSTDLSGGNISIDPLALSLDPTSRIRADGGTQGGNITISAARTPGAVFRGPGTNITATGKKGVSGSINASPANIDIVGSLAQLSTDLKPAALTLEPQCGQMMEMMQMSSFLIQGSGAVPIGPGLWQNELDLQMTPFGGAGTNPKQ